MPLEIPNLTDSQKLYKGLVENLISLNTAINDLQETQAKHHKVLIEGNGDLPLLERVRNLEAFTGTLKFWLRTVSVAIVLQTITFGAAAIVYFVKLYPVLAEIAKTP